MPRLSPALHACLLVALLFVVEAVALASRSFFVVVLPRWEQEFGFTRTEVSLCRALQLTAQATFTAIGGQLADRSPRLTLVGGLSVLGGSVLLTSLCSAPWPLFVTYGLLAGCGYGVTNYNVASSILVRVVPEHRRGLAIGVATAGSPVGQMLLVPAFEKLIAIEGWRPGFVVAGSILLALAPVASVLLREDLSKDAVALAPKSDEDEAGDGATQESVTIILTKLLTSFWFWLVIFAFFICGITAIGVIESHYYVLLTQRGVEGETAAWAFGLLMGANGCGIVLAGMLSDVASRSVVLASIFAIRALSFVMLQFLGTNIPFLIVFSVIFGLVDYAVVPPTAGIVAARAGSHNVGLGFGLMLGIHSAGAALGSVGAGASYDLQGDYALTLTSSVILCGLACLAAISVLTMQSSAVVRTRH
eukprot:TRINITY_DN19314_c0_g1_i4.p1 TRINITY_DN19314_c0_g1~~TRINITY_DN19314_c0_g1_i4.p1  ORF type:complete len:419 (-),score=35.17 TRINITY_DN19314_c0_g1_i4:988-2244(-)